MLIDGIILSGYRSFGPEPQKIGPFNKINLFVGKNNCGKSNILRYLYLHYGKIIDKDDSFEEIDTHKGEVCTCVTFGFAKRLAEAESFIKGIRDGNDHEASTLFQKILPCLENSENGGILWFRLSGKTLNGKKEISEDIITALVDTASPEIRRFWLKLAALTQTQYYNSVSDTHTGDNIRKVLSKIARQCFVPSEVSYIRAIREIKEGSEVGNYHSGLNLISDLQKLERPVHGKKYKQQK